MEIELRGCIPNMWYVMAPDFKGWVEKTPVKRQSSQFPEYSFVTKEAGYSYGGCYKTRMEAAQGLIAYLTKNEVSP